MTENNNPEINVQDLMTQIRHEVAQKKVQASDNGTKVTQYVHEGIVLNRISENKDCIPDKPKYTLAEFLEFQDADFIRSAYRGILRREPDASGYEHYGNLLYTGKMSKIEILGRLRYSAEGRFCKVPVRGLIKPFLARSAFRLPVLGTTAAIASAVVKLPTIMRNQVSFENYTYRHQREHVEQINIIADQIEGAIAQIQKSFVSLAQTIDAQAISIEEANKNIQNLSSAFDTKFHASVHDLNLALDTKATHEQLSQLHNQLIELMQSKADSAQLDTHKADTEAHLQNLSTAIETKLDTASQDLISALEAKAGNEQLSQLNDQLIALIQSKAEATDVVTTSQLILAELEQKAGITALEAHKADTEKHLQNLSAAIEIKLDTASQDLISALETKAGHEQLSQLNDQLIALIQSKADTTVKSLNLALDTKADNEQLTKLTNHLVNLVQTKADSAQLDTHKADTDVQLKTHRETLLAEIAQKTNVTEQELQEIKRQIHDQKHNILDQHRRLAVLLEEARKRLPEPFSKKQLSKMVEEEDHLLDAFYVSFEDQFRGTRADIKERASVYLPAINLAKAGTETTPILDIGCGRGEWLEFLKENELHAQGVDVNHVMVSQCAELGLEVINGDAIDYLRTIKSNSLGAVTGMHIIEHIPFKRLIALFDEVLRVLKPGGVAIFETPNPENLIVGACNFYYDPTHLNPLPPEPMRFVLEARGFGSIEIMRLHPNSDAMIKEGSAQVQAAINEMMFGPQDYALVAYKN